MDPEEVDMAVLHLRELKGYTADKFDPIANNSNDFSDEFSKVERRCIA